MGVIARRARQLLRAVPWRRQDPTLDPDVLFDGHDAAFKAALASARVYAEYGVGKSAVWALRNTPIRVVAVDTVQGWIDHVRGEAGAAAERLDAVHVDLGPTARHGRPVSYSHREDFSRYTEALWTRDEKPDVVLIDGRFRVCCFLTSVRNAEPGTLLIFDDYVPRPHYHVCEAFVGPTEFAGRQALFRVPGKVDRDAIDHAVERFRYVMD